MSKLPERGEDPRYDMVMDFLHRCVLNDPECLKILVCGILRFLREKYRLPGVPIPFDELASALNPDTPAMALAFGIHPDMGVVMTVQDAATKTEAMDKVREMMPNLEREQIIDAGSGPKGKQ